MKKYFRKLKNRKKGFTLLESIIALAIFAVVATLFTAFVMSSNKILSDSYALTIQRNELNKSINSNQSNKSMRIISNADQGNDNMLDSNNYAGKGAITGKVIIDTEHARLYGPYATKNGDQLDLYIGKLIKTVKGDKKFRVVENREQDIKITTSTKFDKNGKPIRTYVKGEVIKKK